MFLKQTFSNIELLYNFYIFSTQHRDVYITPVVTKTPAIGSATIPGHYRVAIEHIHQLTIVM